MVSAALPGRMFMTAKTTSEAKMSVAASSASLWRAKSSIAGKLEHDALRRNRLLRRTRPGKPIRRLSRALRRQSRGEPQRNLGRERAREADLRVARGALVGVLLQRAVVGRRGQGVALQDLRAAIDLDERIVGFARHRR